MSSLKSSTAGPELTQAVTAAIIEVAEHSFSMFTESCTPRRFDELLSRSSGQRRRMDARDARVQRPVRG